MRVCSVLFLLGAISGCGGGDEPSSSPPANALHAVDIIAHADAGTTGDDWWARDAAVDLAYLDAMERFTADDDPAEPGLCGELGPPAPPTYKVVTCADKPRGWRSIASPSTQLGTLFYFDTSWTPAPVWSGREVLTLGRSYVCEEAGACALRTVALAYDPVTDRWRSLPPPSCAAYRSLYTGKTGKEWILWSGTESCSFDLATGAWTPLPKSPLSNRTLAAVTYATTSAELLVWGGRAVTNTGDRNLADGAAYSPEKGTWRPISKAPIKGRSVRQTAWTGARMIVALGARIEPTSGVEYAVSRAAAYDPVRDAWSMLCDPPGDRLIATAAAAVGDGTSAAFFAPEGGAIFHESIAAWTPLPRVALAGDERRDHTVFSVGGRLHVIGGLGWFGGGGEIPFADGASFDDAENRWSPIPEGGPSARARAHAVWTGCDAIVFGGSDGKYQLHDAKAFRP